MNKITETTSCNSHKVTNELIDQFKAHAEKHYEDGYDVYVEAFTRDELFEHFSECTTFDEMISEAGIVISHREDIMATAF